MKTLLTILLLMSFCLTVYAEENLYVVCSKTNFEVNYQDISSGGENYSLDGTKVQFSNRFTGEQIRQLVADIDVEIYNKEEINSALNTPEWKEPLPIVITIDKKFKNDYSLSGNKLSFLETKLGLK